METLRVLFNVYVNIDDFDKVVYLDHHTPIDVIQRIRVICDQTGYEVTFNKGVV